MSYLGLNTTTDDHAAKASPADVRRKNRQLIFRFCRSDNAFTWDSDKGCNLGSCI